jgi:hypothetical protein
MWRACGGDGAIFAYARGRSAPRGERRIVERVDCECAMPGVRLRSRSFRIFAARLLGVRRAAGAVARIREA